MTAVAGKRQWGAEPGDAPRSYTPGPLVFRFVERLPAERVAGASSQASDKPKQKSDAPN